MAIKRMTFDLGGKPIKGKSIGEPRWDKSKMGIMKTPVASVTGGTPKTWEDFDKFMAEYITTSMPTRTTYTTTSGGPYSPPVYVSPSPAYYSAPTYSAPTYTPTTTVTEDKPLVELIGEFVDYYGAVSPELLIERFIGKGFTISDITKALKEIGIKLDISLKPDL